MDRTRSSSYRVDYLGNQIYCGVTIDEAPSRVYLPQETEENLHVIISARQFFRSVKNCSKFLQECVCALILDIDHGQREVDFSHQNFALNNYGPDLIFAKSVPNRIPAILVRRKTRFEELSKLLAILKTIYQA